MPNRLPEQLSAGIFVALLDLEAAEKNPDYIINMMFWHVPGEFQDKCTVCFAGSVMAGTLGLPADQQLEPDSSAFDDETRSKLLALDRIRDGEIRRAVEHWYGREFIEQFQNKSALLEVRLADVIRVAAYHRDPVLWKRDMTRIAVQLESLGL